mgnify:FL=1
MDFRDRLRAQIDYLGLLDKEVAARAGISKRAIDSYVGARGCMPSADVAVRLAKILEVSVEYLITGEKSAKSENVPEKQNFICLNSFQNKEEQKLIKNFVELSERDKKTVIALAEYLRKSRQASLKSSV